MQVSDLSVIDETLIAAEREGEQCPASEGGHQDGARAHSA